MKSTAAAGSDLRQIVYDAIPDKTTWNELADGIDITFSFQGKKYTFNSRVTDHPRIIAPSRFMEMVLQKGMSLVK